MRPGTLPPLLRGMVLGLLLCSIPAIAASAQSTPASCPAALVCLTYTGVDGKETDFAIDPDEGIYQELVVEEQTTTVKTLAGNTLSGVQTVKLASYYGGNGDTYELIKERVVPRDGIYADANVGDSYGLTELKDAA
jgi:hypothetical protein